MTIFDAHSKRHTPHCSPLPVFYRSTKIRRKQKMHRFFVFSFLISLSVEAKEPTKLAASCGNKIREVELGEACDDGNIVSGDGCRSDCRKEERCGDGIL